MRKTGWEWKAKRAWMPNIDERVKWTNNVPNTHTPTHTHPNRNQCEPSKSTRVQYTVQVQTQKVSACFFSSCIRVLKQKRIKRKKDLCRRRHRCCCCCCIPTCIACGIVQQYWLNWWFKYYTCVMYRLYAVCVYHAAICGLECCIYEYTQCNTHL